MKEDITRQRSRVHIFYIMVLTYFPLGKILEMITLFFPQPHYHQVLKPFLFDNMYRILYTKCINHNGEVKSPHLYNGQA